METEIEKPDERLLWKYYQLSHDDLTEPTKAPKVGWEYVFQYENDDGELRVGCVFINDQEEADEWKKVCEAADGVVWTIKKEETDGNGGVEGN